MSKISLVTKDFLAGRWQNEVNTPKVQDIISS